MKSPVEIAHEVLAGEWGNGEERRTKLAAAGHDPAAIQAIVNDIMRTDKDVLEITVNRQKYSGVLITVEG